MAEAEISFFVRNSRTACYSDFSMRERSTQFRFVSILCVFAIIPAWLSISNHCALGAVSPEKPKAEHSGCPFHATNPAPQKEKPKSDAIPCCKILRAVAFNATKAIPRKFLDLRNIDFSFVAPFLLEPPRVVSASWTLDTGPPGKISFAESIWSMRAHAPPALT